MSIQQIPPKPLGGNWVVWAQRLSSYLTQTRSLLRRKISDDSASEDGLLLWDADRTDPVVSVNGEFVHLVLEGGYASFNSTEDQTVATVDTATNVTFNTTGYSDDITIDSNNERITFGHAGIYSISFSVQVTSDSSSAKELWFWPKVNGSNVDGSTIKVSIKDSHTTVVMSRTAIFSFDASDYLEVMWASDSTDVTLEAFAATSFAPATPSVVLSATRIRQL